MLKFFTFIMSVSFAVTSIFAFEITDMRGKKVEIKEPLNSVATIDDGFVEGVMTHLGVIDKVKVIGSWSMKRTINTTSKRQLARNTHFLAGTR